MSDNNQQWIELVQKLNELTQDGRLNWVKDTVVPAEKGPFFGVLSTFHDAYSTAFKEKGFRITKHSVNLKNGKTDLYRLEIVDSDGASVWTVPNVVGIPDLFQTVKMQSAGVKDFIDDFLRQ